MTKEQIDKEKTNISASFQQAIIDVVIKKTVQAIIEYNAKSILIGGGVSANKELRNQLGEAVKNSTKASYHIPPHKLATDNAAMIASAGTLEHTQKNIAHNPETLSVDSNKQIDK